MSTETELAGLIDHATAAASMLAGKADSLVNSAVGALKTKLNLPGVGEYSQEGSGVTNQGGFWGGFLNPDGQPYNNRTPLNARFGGLVGGKWFTADPKSNSDDDKPPISFPEWPKVQLESIPNTQAFNTVDLSISNLSFPTLNFPAFNYSKIAKAPLFTGAVPSEFTSIEIPTAPPGESIYSPSFIEPLSLDAVAFIRPEVELDKLNITLPVWNDPFGTTFNGIIDKIGEDVTPLIDVLGNWYKSDLDSVLVPALELLKTRLQNKLSPVWEEYTSLRNRLTTRLVDEENRVKYLIPNRSGFRLPAAVLVAQNNFVNQISTAWKAYAEEQVDVVVLKAAVDFFQICGELATSFTTTIQKLKEQEIKLLLEAHKTALIYAKAVITALLEKYNVDVLLRADIFLQREEAEVKAFEAELEVALLQYEEAQFKLKVEEAKQTYDEVLVEKLRNEVAVASGEVQRVATIVSSARLEVRLRKIPITQFELKVKEFEAKVNAYEANIASIVFEIEGDMAAAEGQLKKLEGYEESIKAFKALINTKETIIEAQSVRNEAVINEFKQRILTVLAPIEKEVLDSGYDLKKYETLIEQLIADAKLAIETAKVELNYRTKQQEGQREAYQLKIEQDFALLKSELSRLEGIASVNEHGANVMQEMSRGAMSAVNGVVGLTFKESE